MFTLMAYLTETLAVRYVCETFSDYTPSLRIVARSGRLVVTRKNNGQFEFREAVADGWSF